MTEGMTGGMTGHVVVLATGGTIASRPDADGRSLRSAVGGAELLATAAERAGSIPTAVEEFCNVGSFAMDLDTSFRLARRLDAILAEPDVAGAVVTHGTDTMEEAAFLSDLVVASPKPVVFTGAQRAASEPDADGPRNLADAIRVAVSPACRGIGTVIAFGGEIHAARDATKLHASRPDAFHSAEHGKLGEVDGAAVVLHRRPALRLTVPAVRIEPAVDLIRLAMGSDGRFLRCALDTGARGIVLEAFGRGNVTPAVLATLREAVARGVPVVVTSRCPQGRVLPLYGDSGGAGVAAAGALFAGDLAGVKARILLALLLGGGHDDIGDWFNRAAG